MTTCAPDNFSGTGNSSEQRQYFPSAKARQTTQIVAIVAGHASHAADYSILISVAYPFSCGNREADHLATGFKRPNNGQWQAPKADKRASAHCVATTTMAG